MLLKLAVAAVVETIYAIITRAGLPHALSGIPLELAITACRAAAAVVFWLLFRDLIAAKQRTSASLRDPLAAAGILVFLSVPIITGDNRMDDVGLMVVYALTSVVVAIKEEILYRGALQNLIKRRFGRFLALFISNIVFILYHYGTRAFTPRIVAGYFVAGCVMGLVYDATGTLASSIMMHAVYDALWPFTPLLPYVWTGWTGIWLLVLSMALLVAWDRREWN
jgi:membrane protease YdiL (CAAX protease family)